MKVSDIMQTNVERVSINTPVREVSRIIFGRSINGVPVCDGKKIVGFITERDILLKFYPTMEEYMSNPLGSDFEGMEKNVADVLKLPARDIMNKNPKTVSSDTPILKAQSIMQIAKVGRLPVVDSEGNLLGIVSKGDIFRVIIGSKLPLGQEEKFYDWFSKHYDIFIDWKRRLNTEIPELAGILEKARVKTVLDVASSTGEHSIALAKKGFKMYGVDASALITKDAEKKLAEESKSVQSKVKFITGRYDEVLHEMPETIDAAMFLGNALSHVQQTDKEILADINKVLNPYRATIILQTLNYERITEDSVPSEEFVVRPSALGFETKHAFLGFYTRTRGGKIIYTQAIFDFDGEKWNFSGTNNTQILEINRVKLRRALRRLGFNKIFYYGGKMYGPLFKEEFNPKTSMYLNIIAKR